MIKLRSVFLFLSLFLMGGLAHAADQFTVSGVRVDAQAETAIQAQIAATEQGQVTAAQILIERLTLESERVSKNLPPIDIDVARKLIRGQQIGNEKRSANRYLGDITVAFNPSRVQSYLRENGLNMITTQARPRLVLPILNGQSPFADTAWARSWTSGGHGHALTPIITDTARRGSRTVITAGAASRGDMDALKRAGQHFNVEQILVAEASGGRGQVTVSVSDYAIDTGERRDLGTVRASSYAEAAAKIVNRLEADWKQASVSLAATAQSMTVSVLYDNLSDWQSLQSVINGSAQIRGARLDALSKDGAMMTLTYGGDMDRLQNELAYKGVKLGVHPKIGTYLARSNFRVN
ncbi:MAG: DUF2066 domain-containing protein [Maricaulaceae bacterium]